MVRFAIVACLLSVAASAPVQADVLLIERTQAAKDMDLPRRGEMMAQVEKRFGAPSRKHASVGGGSPVHPPITRWDYPNFSVYFEHSHVVDAVLAKSSAHETGPKSVTPKR